MRFPMLKVLDERTNTGMGVFVLAIEGLDFLWRLLQHVLPTGLQRARNFGCLHHNSRRALHVGWPENPVTAVDGNRCMCCQPVGRPTPSARRRPIPRINLQRRNSPFHSSRTGLVQQTDQIAAAHALSLLVRANGELAHRLVHRLGSDEMRLAHFSKWRAGL